MAKSPIRRLGAGENALKLGRMARRTSGVRWMKSMPALKAAQPKSVNPELELVMNNKLRTFLDGLANESAQVKVTAAPVSVQAVMEKAEVSPASIGFTGARHLVSLFFNFSGSSADGVGWGATCQRENAMLTAFNQLKGRLQTEFPGIVIHDWEGYTGSSINKYIDQFGLHMVEVEFPS